MYVIKSLLIPPAPHGVGGETQLYTGLIKTFLNKIQTLESLTKETYMNAGEMKGGCVSSANINLDCSY